MYYANKLYSNSNMATRSELQQGDIVLIMDLASNSGRSSPHPALGRIISFMDEEDEEDGEKEGETQHALEVHEGIDDDDDQEVQRHLPGSHLPLPPPTPDQLLRGEKDEEEREEQDEEQEEEEPEKQDNILTLEEGDTHLWPLQGEQEDKKTHDLGGHTERDGIAITKTGWPTRFKRLLNKFQ